MAEGLEGLGVGASPRDGEHGQHVAAAGVARLHRAFDEASREQGAGEPVRLAAVA
jgi:hypothetical protein